MASAAFKYVPQTIATTFAFSSVFILLLGFCSLPQTVEMVGGNLAGGEGDDVPAAPLPA